MDELERVVLEDDLARSGRDILAELEGGEIGLLDAQPPLAGLDVLLEILQSFDEIGAVAGERGAQHFRIGEREIGRRDRIGDLVDIEARLVARMIVEALARPSPRRPPSAPR